MTLRGTADVGVSAGDADAERDSKFYDERYSDTRFYGKHYSRSAYFPVFTAVVKELKRRNVHRVLEVGCGSGTLAEYILDKTSAEYAGFDFSSVAVERARKRLKRLDLFRVADATNPDAYIVDYEFDCIVCTEVLEHIKEDRTAISNWRSGTACICTVPNFPYEGHVRFFSNESEVSARYGDLIEFDSIQRISKPILQGRTLKQYITALRWSRNDPKRLLGLLGVQTFQNVGGWFVFAGRRR
jgi:cyclopropane fatty-acyl-phospholipid synthase-like methyltransferase